MKGTRPLDNCEHRGQDPRSRSAYRSPMSIRTGPQQICSLTNPSLRVEKFFWESSLKSIADETLFLELELHDLSRLRNNETTTQIVKIG